MFEIGDSVQGPDGRVGTVVAVKKTKSQVERIIVRFIDSSLWDGSPDHFRVVPR